MPENYDKLYVHGFVGDKFLLYRFSREEGILQLSMSQGDLERLLKSKDISIDKGRVTLELPLPGPSFPLRIVLNGVKRIETIPGVKEYFFGAKNKAIASR